MEDTSNRKTLQLFYAAVLVDSVSNYSELGALERLTEKKAREQAIAAPGQLSQLGIRTPRELFERFAEIFGCAQWHVTEEPGGSTTAETRSCLACAIAKKRGSPRPCDMYCINPFRGLAGAMKPAADLDVVQTLWDSDRCLFRAKV